MLENKLSRVGVLDQMKIRLTQPSFTETGAWAELGNIWPNTRDELLIPVQKFCNGWINNPKTLHYKFDSLDASIRYIIAVSWMLPIKK